MRAITFYFSGAGTLAWMPDNDVLFVGAQISRLAANQALLISTSPTLTRADLITPGNTEIRDDVIAYYESTIPHPNVAVAIPAGVQLYLSSNVNLAAIVYFEDRPS